MGGRRPGFRSRDRSAIGARYRQPYPTFRLQTNRRRTIQEAYNKEHGITPTTIKKAVRDLIAVSKAVAETEVRLQKDPESMTRKELTKLIAQVEKQMRAAAADLNFEQAAELRDKMIDLKKNLDTLDK